MSEFVKVFKNEFVNGSKTHRAQIEMLTMVIFDDKVFCSQVRTLLEIIDKKELEKK